jgi:hypothetical protein
MAVRMSLVGMSPMPVLSLDGGGDEQHGGET